MNKPTESQPSTVSKTTTQEGDIRLRWGWVEPAIWSDRMLAALEQGVKGGKWFSLIDKVFSKQALENAFAKVKSNHGGAGVDRETIEQFDRRRVENLEHLRKSLVEGSYQPLAIKRCHIPKPGSKETRPLGIPAVRDRIVQASLRAVLEPIFEADFSRHSYGFRPGRGCKDALRRVDKLLREGKTWVVDVDLKSYFDSIPHGPLMKLVEMKVADGRVLSLIDAFLHQNVLDEMKEWTPEKGTPQGAVVSPLLSNIYLDPLDKLMMNHGIEMVRYADDMVILCPSREDAQGAYTVLRDWTQAANLTLHPEKTRIVDAREKGGFEFLGYRFERKRRWPRKKSLDKLKNTIKEKTKRTNGTCLQAIISNLNKTLIGWFEYFKHCYKSTFPSLDGWIRGRIRSILRKRRKRKGRARGTDHQRWPNSFFQDRGLYSLESAHYEACQSQS